MDAIRTFADWRLLRPVIVLIMAVVTVAAWVPRVEAGENRVTSVRAWAHPKHTRFVLEAASAPTYSYFSLSEPNRLVIDFPQLVFELPPGPQPGQQDVGLVAGFRYGLFESGTSRMVLDLSQPATIVRDFVLPPGEGRPFRLVIDLEPVTEEAFLAAAVRPPKPETARARPNATVPAVDSAQPRVAPPMRKPRRDGNKFTVVIDPGHGGIDPGATGRGGIHEKDIALAVARDLKTKLEQTGRYQVALTRAQDIFLRLRDRVAIARERGADLFLSLHADTIDDRSIRGAHVYSLSEKASDAEAAALAAKENRADIIAGVDLTMFTAEVGSILLDLAQRETNNVSSDIADTVVDEFRVTGVHTVRKPHRQAGFAVLKAPDVPSILIELGFLSNVEDERMLVDRSSRAPLVTSIARAVHRHFDTRIAGSM